MISGKRRHHQALAARIERRQADVQLNNVSKQVWAIFHRRREIFPTGYLVGMSAGSGAEWVVSLTRPTELGAWSEAPLQACGTKPLPILAQLLRLAREDAQITEVAKAMCRALGHDPAAFIPYPFGGMQVGVVSGYGGAFVGAAAAETRPALMWMRPHAAALHAGAKAMQAIQERR